VLKNPGVLRLLLDIWNKSVQFSLGSSLECPFAKQEIVSTKSLLIFLYEE